LLQDDNVVAGDICVPDEKGSRGEGGDAATDEIGFRIVVPGRSTYGLFKVVYTKSSLNPHA
jgi:hypothetical protein